MDNTENNNNEVETKDTITEVSENDKVTTETENVTNNSVEATADNGQTQIKLESSKNTLAKRPWRLGAIQVPRDDGSKVWVAAVIDSNGNAVCCGDTVDIEFILKLENSYDQILKATKASCNVLSDAVEVLQDFECKKNKAFRFN